MRNKVVMSQDVRQYGFKLMTIGGTTKLKNIELVTVDLAKFFVCIR